MSLRKKLQNTTLFTCLLLSSKTQTMGKVVLVIMLPLFFSINVIAQNVGAISNGNIGYSKSPFGSEVEHVDGTPFYNKQYCSGSIQLANGKIYDGLNLKLNLKENKIIATLYDGVEIVITSPVNKVVMGCKNAEQPVVFLAGLPKIDQQNERSFYQVLDSGKITLLKYTEVRYKDTKDYNGNYITRRKYYQTPEYYIWSSDKNLIKVSLNEDELLSSLSPLRKPLLNIILKENIKLKKESDLIRIITLYNQSDASKP
jgi:hypothetical protein